MKVIVNINPKLIYELKNSKGINCKILASRIKNFNCVQSRVYRSNLFKCYKLFLNLISENDKKELIEIDNNIDVIISNMLDSGWTIKASINLNPFYNFSNENIEFYRNGELPFVVMSENGYVPLHSSSFKENIDEADLIYLRKIEEEFLIKYENELKQLNELVLRKKEIMNGNFELKNEKDREFVSLLLEYVGFRKKEEKGKHIK